MRMKQEVRLKQDLENRNVKFGPLKTAHANRNNHTLPYSSLHQPINNNNNNSNLLKWMTVSNIACGDIIDSVGVIGRGRLIDDNDDSDTSMTECPVALPQHRADNNNLSNSTITDPNANFTDVSRDDDYGVGEDSTMITSKPDLVADIAEKMADAALSGVKDVVVKDNNNDASVGVEKFASEVVPRKKEKMEHNRTVRASFGHLPANMSRLPANAASMKPASSSFRSAAPRPRPMSTGGKGSPHVRRREAGGVGGLTRKDDMGHRKSAPVGHRRMSPDKLGEFDVYNIETAMPKIDWDTMEAHLRAAKDEEQRRRNDREEIRKKLAMGPEPEDVYDRTGRKPSLQSRLQSGMNLQICFMNETASDADSADDDSDMEMKLMPPKKKDVPKIQDKDKVVLSQTKPSSVPMNAKKCDLLPNRSRSWGEADRNVDFFTRQAQLQAEARMALAQAKEMARMQMEIEKQSKLSSPITDMVGIPFPEGRRRLSRQILTDMNVAQLQVIVNDLHSQIELLNEQLVKMLIDRDDLHMEQDSMLVDIEDLTRYFSAKEQTLQRSQSTKSTPLSSLTAPSLRSHSVKK